MRRLAGDKADSMKFAEADVRDRDALERIFAGERFDAVIHFAGFKAVGESVAEPLSYYNNNLVASLVLLQAMAKHGVKRLVFSSSCTVYGTPDRMPIDEAAPLEAVSPYGRTKLFQEHMFRDACAADRGLSVLLLRYFNPVGAHPSGELGEHPVGTPNNLMPYIQQVALGQRPSLKVYGSDYPTPDGTAVRDYIHVMDLAEGHVAAVAKLASAAPGFGCRALNLGTGKGTSVLEMISVWEAATGARVAWEAAPRRQGDAVAVWAATAGAEAELGWRAARGVAEMCRDQWAWASKYPRGFETEAAEASKAPEVSEAGDARKPEAV
ncbi:UDP-glucose 4-epimerase [Raphidocelis subcapitata]|uniref:UDP-glucose 4-epimerase n=1 Tax=Raphidocelis subcapitata TaxID=307507 RepID=A0A2V0NRY1_9CHLO|nr:UDP-glucose 4-epimerase [Raphidocelis subcapitata]|eukprot:GBF90428.1 UDP-glucose 4-epimerase [Raphidocelis subcapitata]